MRIGIISDTHNFLDPKVFDLFRGVEHILHGGDIGSPELLAELGKIAPVTAVSGNTDDGGFRYPDTQRVDPAGTRFLLHHIVTPHQFAESLSERTALEKPQVVVFGHTHKAFHEWIGKTLFFNPGYAGKSRFGMERSIAVMNCETEGITWKYYPL